jgi:hypothetical protein
VTGLLHREGLERYARVVHAPLEGEPPWYARAALERLPDPIDLLVVDGPPAEAPGEGERRAPALPALASRLVPGATVVLDDAERPGERAVLARWEAGTAWRFAVDPSAGVALGRLDPQAAAG